MISATDTVTFEERVAESIKLAAQQMITYEALANAIEVRSMTDFAANRLVAELSVYLAGNVRDEWEEVEVRRWASLWDEWKAIRAPRWLARHLADPKMTKHTRVRRKRWTDLYPELPMPRAAGRRRVWVEQTP